MTCLGFVWWYKETELYSFMRSSCILLSDEFIKPHSMEEGLDLNARNVIVKWNCSSSSKVFKESSRSGCEMKHYTEGKGRLHKGLVSLANLQDYGCPRQRVANSHLWRARGIMNFLSHRRYFLDLIFTDIRKDFHNLFICSHWSHGFKIIQKYLFYYKLQGRLSVPVCTAMDAQERWHSEPNLSNNTPCRWFQIPAMRQTDTQG